MSAHKSRFEATGPYDMRPNKIDKGPPEHLRPGVFMKKALNIKRVERAYPHLISRHLTRPCSEYTAALDQSDTGQPAATGEQSAPEEHYICFRG